MAPPPGLSVLPGCMIKLPAKVAPEKTTELPASRDGITDEVVTVVFVKTAPVAISNGPKGVFERSIDVF